MRSYPPSAFGRGHGKWPARVRLSPDLPVQRRESPGRQRELKGAGSKARPLTWRTRPLTLT